MSGLDIKFDASIARVAIGTGDVGLSHGLEGYHLAPFSSKVGRSGFQGPKLMKRLLPLRILMSSDTEYWSNGCMGVFEVLRRNR